MLRWSGPSQPPLQPLRHWCWHGTKNLSRRWGRAGITEWVILIKADESQECLSRRCKLRHIPRWSEAVRVNMLSINICSNTAPVTARTGKGIFRSIWHVKSEMFSRGANLAGWQWVLCFLCPLSSPRHQNPEVNALCGLWFYSSMAISHTLNNTAVLMCVSSSSALWGRGMQCLWLLVICSKGEVGEGFSTARTLQSSPPSCTLVDQCSQERSAASWQPSSLKPLCWSLADVWVVFVTAAPGILTMDSILKNSMASKFSPLTGCLKHPIIKQLGTPWEDLSYLFHINAVTKYYLYYCVSLSYRKAENLYFGQSPVSLLLATPRLNIFTWTLKAHCISVVSEQTHVLNE